MFSSSTQVIYFCDLGYTMRGEESSRLTCNNGDWMGRVPQCFKTDRCGKPPSVSDATLYSLNGTSLTEVMTHADGSKVLYICNPGYEQRGSSTVTCQFGEWSGQGPSCRRISQGCSSPPDIVNGGYSVNRYLNGQSILPANAERIPDGSQAFYFCQNGYRMSNTSRSILTCRKEMWQGTISDCSKLAYI